MSGYVIGFYAAIVLLSSGYILYNNISLDEYMSSPPKSYFKK